MKLMKCIASIISSVVCVATMMSTVNAYDTFDPEDRSKYIHRYSDGEFEYYLRTNDDGFGISGYIGGSGSEDVVIPSEYEGFPVVCIADWSFRNARNIRYIGIPGSVKLVGSSSFSGCVRLKNVILCEGVKRIAADAFYNCESLESISIPASATDVTPSAFDNCINLQELVFLNPDTFIDSMSIYGFTGIIYGWSGSTAEAYANKYGYLFQPMDGFISKDATCLLEPPQKYPIKSNYDANADRTVSIADAIIFERFLTEDPLLDPAYISFICNNLDIDNDGELTITDLTLLLDYISKI